MEYAAENRLCTHACALHMDLFLLQMDLFAFAPQHPPHKKDFENQYRVIEIQATTHSRAQKNSNPNVKSVRSAWHLKSG